MRKARIYGSMKILDSTLREWPHGFAARVVGNSMRPTFEDGDGVWIDPTAAVQEGAAVAVQFLPGNAVGQPWNSAMVGRYAPSAEGDRCTKDNRDFDAVLLGRLGRDYRIWGRVVAIVSREVRRESI